MTGFYFAHDFGALAARVLDCLRFVKNQQMVAMPRQLMRIAPQQGIGSQHHIMLGDLTKAPFALDAMQRKNRQARRKARRLILPVENE